MEQKTKLQKFQYYEKIYGRMTISLIVLSSLLLVLGYALVKSVTPAPMVLIYFTTGIFYYHFVHFALGFTFVGYYLTKIRQKFGKTKILRSIVSILFTPISFIIIYTAVFLITISSCAG